MTPTVLQAQPTECGIASLAMLLAHHGRWEQMEDVRRVVGASRDGTTATQIARAGQHYGFDVDVRSCEPDDLASLGLPLIVHLRFLHFVVLEELDERRAIVNDPICGRTELPRAEFDVQHTGIAIRLTPGEGFERRGQPERPLQRSARRVLARWPLVGLVLVAAAAAVLGAAGAVRELGLAAAGSTASPTHLAGATLLTLIAGGLAGVTRVRLGRRLIESSTAPFLRHLLRLPAAVHAYRVPAFLQGIVGATEHTAWLESELVGHAAKGLVSLLVLTPLLLGVDGPLTLALLTVLVTAAAGQRVMARHELLLARKAGHQSSPSFVASARSLLNMIAVKTNGHDGEVLANRASQAALQLTGQQRVAERSMAGLLVRQATVLTASLLVLLAGLLPGRLDLGDAVTWLGLALVLLHGLSGLPEAHHQLDELRHVLPLQDELCDLVPSAPLSTIDSPPSHPTPGTVVARDLVFGFDRHRAPLLEGVSLSVPAGGQVGITGSTGCGKSTLAALLVGLHEPWSGTVEVGGRPLPSGGLHETVAWLDSSTFLFPGTVRENLLAWRENLTDEQLWQVLREARLDSLIAARGGLDARVEASGLNFSAGQRQRLELARAFAGSPDVLVLDEAMDALDDATQEGIRATCRERGRTLLVISHRASAMALCDDVLLLQDGRPVLRQRTA
ncbi:MAG: cysteine peptidase family C39 domain-containing protein [Acidobacteriota bacterium]